MILILKTAKLICTHETPAHDDAATYKVWFKGSAVQKLEDTLSLFKKITKMLTFVVTLTTTFLYCDLHPEHSNPIYSQNAQAYDNIYHMFTSN